MTESTRSPYRRFVFAAANRVVDATGEDRIELTAPGTGRSYRLSPTEFSVARLFDGSRDGDQVRAAAGKSFDLRFSAAELERFANELAVAGCLEPGEQEPLPVPPQSDAEPRNAGWKVEREEREPPPSILPGSLSGPGRTGSIVGLWGVLRGQADPIRVGLPLWPWLWLGYIGAAAAFSSILAWVLLTFTVGGLYGLGIHHGLASIDLLRLLGNLPVLAAVVILGSWFVNLFGQIARVAAIRHYTGTRAPFGLVFGFGFIPRFRVDTAGAPESAGKHARLGIIGATLAAQMLVFVIGVLLWLMFRQGDAWLPVVAVGVAIVGLIFFLLNLNPVVRRDGYFLLATALGISDLREQAILALLGKQRPWREAKPAPPWALRLYGLLVVAYIAWICVFLTLYPGRWFVGHWGATALVIFLLLIAYLIYVQVRRATSPRSRVGDVVLSAPSQLHYAIACGLAVVALLPFPFQPSGAFVTLPMARADLTAQIDGPVVAVLVDEGDLVKKGQPLVRIADDAQRSAVAGAKAHVAQLQAQLALVRGGHKPQEIELAQQKVAAARKRYKFSKLMADRVAAAHAQHAVSDQQFDRARQGAAVDKEALLTAQRNLALVRSPAQGAQIKAIQSGIDRARAKLAFDQHEVKLATVRAPIDGRVVSATLEFAVGQYVHRGDVIGHVQRTHRLQVRISLPQTQIGEIKRGAQAYAKVWAYPDHSFPGHVTDIAPSVSDSADGKVVRVKMVLDNTTGLLKPGMSGYAKIDAGTYPVIVVFTRAIYRFFFVEVWSWLP